MGHARAVATAPDPEALTRDVIAKGLSVRQTEERARFVKPGAGAGTARAGARNAAALDPMSSRSSDSWGIRWG